MLTFFQPGADTSDRSQACPVCGAGQPVSLRYPKCVCSDCVRTSVDELGRPVSFQNCVWGDGVEVVVSATGETLKTRHFFVRGQHCRVFEGKFGGFVVELVGTEYGAE